MRAILYTFAFLEHGIMAWVEISHFFFDELFREERVSARVDMQVVPEVQQFVNRHCLEEFFLFFLRKIFCQLMDDFLADIHCVFSVVGLHGEAWSFVDMFFQFHKIKDFCKAFFLEKFYVWFFHPFWKVENRVVDNKGDVLFFHGLFVAAQPYMVFVAIR